MRAINARVSKLIANTLYQFCERGLSLNFDLGEPKEGFMVSTLDKGLTFDNVGKVNPLKVADWVHENLNNTDYFGVWSHDEGVFFDIFQNIASKKLALSLGRERDQFAIYDVINKCDITI